MKLKKSELKKLVKEVLKEEDTEYQKFFRKALKKFNVNSPDEFKSDEEKKKFFNYVDANYKAKNENNLKEEIKLPGDIGIRLNKFLSSIEGVNLNKQKKFMILNKISKALGIDKSKFVMFTNKIKKEI